LTIAFLVILVLAWSAVFLPAVLRANRSTPLSASRRFQQGLDKIAPNYRGRWVVVPKAGESDRAARRHRVQQERRKNAFVILIGTAIGTLLFAPFMPVLWAVHLVVDFLLLSFVVLLIAAKRRREESLNKIRPLTRSVRSVRDSSPVPFGANATRSSMSR
jgi:hypothetical protein